MSGSVLGRLAQRAWWIYLLAGIALVLVGIAIIAWPNTTLFVLVMAVGIGWIVEGVATFIAVAQGAIAGSKGWAIAAGILSILAGLVAALHPAIGGIIGVTTIVFLLGFGMVFSGVRWAVEGWRATPRDGWAITLGVLYVIGATLIMLNPMFSGLVLIITVGVWSCLAGITAIGAAFVARRAARDILGDARAARS